MALGLLGLGFKHDQLGTQGDVRDHRIRALFAGELQLDGQRPPTGLDRLVVPALGHEAAAELMIGPSGVRILRPQILDRTQQHLAVDRLRLREPIQVAEAIGDVQIALSRRGVALAEDAPGDHQGGDGGFEGLVEFPLFLEVPREGVVREGDPRMVAAPDLRTDRQHIAIATLGRA